MRYAILLLLKYNLHDRIRFGNVTITRNIVSVKYRILLSLDLFHYLIFLVTSSFKMTICGRAHYRQYHMNITINDGDYNKQFSFFYCIPTGLLERYNFVSFKKINKHSTIKWCSVTRVERHIVLIRPEMEASSYPIQFLVFRTHTRRSQ